MAKFDDLINRGDKIFDTAESGLTLSVTGSETEIVNELMRIFDTVTINAGKLEYSTKAGDFLKSLDAKIYAVLKKAGYPDAVKQYLKYFNQVGKNVQEIHSQLNKLNITDAQIDSYKQFEVQKTYKALTEAGLENEFIAPLRQSIYRSIRAGESVTMAQKKLTEFVKGKGDQQGRLTRYVKQIGQDSIMQFDGTLQSAIANELGLNAKRYVGSLIRDSRGQCFKWVGMGIIMVADLAEEIAWAKRGGMYRGRRCSGMIDDTTVDTFDIYRGGWRCRHRSIPTHRKVGDSIRFV
jgi:hypothetical protein